MPGRLIVCSPAGFRFRRWIGFRVRSFRFRVQVLQVYIKGLGDLGVKQNQVESCKVEAGEGSWGSLV